MYSYSDKQNHDQRVEFERFNTLYETKEVLTSEEYEFVINYDSSLKNNFMYYQYNDTYLNLNVYSEVDKEQLDYRKEIGY